MSAFFKRFERLANALRYIPVSNLSRHGCESIRQRNIPAFLFFGFKPWPSGPFPGATSAFFFHLVSEIILAA
jgi:hypothetical protein